METLVTSNAELNASVGFLGKVALARPTYRSVYDNADKIMRRSISYFPHRVIFSFPLKHATLSTAKKDSRDQSRGARFVVSLSLFLLLPLLFSFSLSLPLSAIFDIASLLYLFGRLHVVFPFDRRISGCRSLFRYHVLPMGRVPTEMQQLQVTSTASHNDCCFFLLLR